jgi:chromosomal replication initiator protein
MATLPRELTIAQIMLADEPGFRRMTIAAVIDACARHYGVAPGLILEPDGGAGQRDRWISRPRQMAMYLAHELTEASISQIGRHFSRHHTTVMHACKQVSKLIEKSEFTRADIRSVMRRLGAAEMVGRA